jgi:hypothetical protein
VRWSVVALLAAIPLLAGCLEDAAAPPAQVDMQPDDPDRTARSGRGGQGRDEDGQPERGGNVTLRSFSDQFDFTFTQASAVVRFTGIQGYNCVAVERAPYHILNGTMTLTWTSQSALTDSLDAEIRTYYSSSIYETDSGPSPLVVEFKDLEVEEDPDFQDFLTFAVQVPQMAGAAYEQDVTMALAFDYESDVDVGTSSSYC